MEIGQIFRLIRFYLAFHYFSIKHLAKDLVSTDKSLNDQLSVVPNRDPVPHEALLDCYRDILKWCGAQIIPVNSSLPPLATSPTLFLCNHRSAADFFVDGYVSNGAAYLGLLKSFFYFPFACTLGYRNKSLVLFKKKSTKNDQKRQELYQKALKVLKQKSLIIYPEGSRNVASESLPLKRGFLKFAFENGVPVQILMTSNKERIFSAKTKSAEYNVICHISRSPVYYPKDYRDLDEWIQTLDASWKTEWTRVSGPST